jgi:predicted GIY-YIG superfamily endonuclease
MGMHYCKDQSPVALSDQRETLDDLAEDIAHRVPSDSYVETSTPAPFTRDTGLNTIVIECLPFCTGTPRTDAVYVLECFQSSSYRRTSAESLRRTNKRWEGDVEEADRLIYVGMTVNLLRRIDEHLNSPGDDGAHFTTVFPPVRLLNVSWWPSFNEAMRAEEAIADHLQERFPSDYIYQL